MSSLGIKDVDFGEHGVIYLYSDKERPLLTEWTTPATRELLEILSIQFGLFNRGRLSSKRRLYDNCSAYLKGKHFNYTSAQCENKWKSLKRRYLTKYEKLATGKPIKNGRPRHMFDDEIETVLKIERPAFKREMDEMSKINLNIPPGFEENKEDGVEVNDDDDKLEDFDETENEYTQSDEKLVKWVLRDGQSADEESLKDNKNSVLADNVEYYVSNLEDEAVNDSSNEKYTSHDVEHVGNGDRLVKEVRELRKVIKRSLDTNTDVLKTHNATHEQLLICLDTLDKREEEKIELKRRKLDKQGELVQQVKIQNSLIAKLIQKLTGTNTNR